METDKDNVDDGTGIATKNAVFLSRLSRRYCQEWELGPEGDVKRAAGLSGARVKAKRGANCHQPKS